MKRSHIKGGEGVKRPAVTVFKCNIVHAEELSPTACLLQRSVELHQLEDDTDAPASLPEIEERQ